MKSFSFVPIYASIFMVLVVPAGAQTLDAVLLASDPTLFATFGKSVALHDRQMVVGGPVQDGAVFDTGAAYILERTATGWTQLAKIFASGGVGGDNFGEAVDLNARFVVVGAPGVDGAGPFSGAAYVFDNTASGYVQAATLTGAGGPFDHFGEAVAIDGVTIAVSAKFEGNGTVYVFVRTAGSWVLQAQLTSPNPTGGDDFGFSVDVSGDTLVIGAPDHASVASGAGAAYVYDRDSLGNWSLTTQLAGSTTASFDGLGWSVAIDRDLLIAGAPKHDLGGVIDVGTAYVFGRTGGVWSEQAALSSSGASAGDLFGWSADIDGLRAVVGAWRDDVVVGNGGAAYIFAQQTGAIPQWLQQSALTPSSITFSDAFGYDVAIEGRLTAVGAPYADNPSGAEGEVYVYLP